MTPNQTRDSSLLASKVLFLIAGLGIVAAEWVDHGFIVGAPAPEPSLLHWIANLLLLSLFGLAVFMMLRYEQRMSALNAELQTQNQSLSLLESHVDQRLVDSAQSLNLALASVVTQAELALQRTGDLEDIKVFSQLIDEAERMEAISNELIEIKRLDAASLAAKEV